MKAIPCHDYFVQPEWPEDFGGTAPMRCESYDKGPHVWIEGGILDDGTWVMYECKVCSRGGNDCEECVDPDSSEGCVKCCGVGIIPA